MPTKLSRRDFLRLAAGSAAAISMSGFLAPFIKEAVAAGAPPVIWLQGASCTGCSVSLLNTVHPSIKEVLLDVISLRYHPNISAGCGDLMMEEINKVANDNKGKFFLVIEGSVPTGENGMFCTVGETKDGKPITFESLVKDLGNKAFAVLNIGTCSAYGGVPAAGSNPTGCVPVSEIIDNTYINIPGCPPHPDWIVGTIAYVLMYNKVPELDVNKRPTMFYGGVIHDNCPRRQYFDNAIFAKTFSEPGCLLEIGCKGPIAHCDSTTRLWNGGVNWCIKSGAPCLACTEPEFPWPVYERLPGVPLGPRINATINEVGAVLAGATALGIGGHLIGNIATGRIGGHEEEKKEGDV